MEDNVKVAGKSDTNDSTNTEDSDDMIPYDHSTYIRLYEPTNDQHLAQLAIGFLPSWTLCCCLIRPFILQEVCLDDMSLWGLCVISINKYRF